MKVLSFLILFVCIPHLSFEYTVVLKTGKLVVGQLLGEDRLTFQLKDSSGILLSVKKSTVDLDATRLRNSSLKASLPKKTVVLQPARKTIVQIAESNRRAQARTKIYTKEDLHALPELSVLGSDEIPKPVVSSESVELPSKAEMFWRKEATSLRKRLESLREKSAGVEEACDRARQNSAVTRSKPHKKAIDLLSTMDEPTVCKKHEELLTQLEDAQTRWDDFEIRARRAGVPWNWLE